MKLEGCYFLVVQEELSSPLGIDGGDLVCSVDILFILPQRCHPQAL